MLPRVLKYSGANFWDLKEDQVDFDEMKGAYLRATQDDIVTRLRMSADLINGFPKALAKSVFPTGWLSEAADEIERLRTQVRELQSEIQRLEKLANYGQ